MPRLNGKFVSQKAYDDHMAAQAAESETRMSETITRKPRTADPLLAAKRRLEAARKAAAKVEKKRAAVKSIEQEWETVSAELTAATEEFKAAVEAV